MCVCPFCSLTQHPFYWQPLSSHSPRSPPYTYLPQNNTSSTHVPYLAKQEAVWKAYSPHAYVFNCHLRLGSDKFTLKDLHLEEGRLRTLIRKRTRLNDYCTSHPCLEKGIWMHLWAPYPHTPCTIRHWILHTDGALGLILFGAAYEPPKELDLLRLYSAGARQFGQYVADRSGGWWRWLLVSEGINTSVYIYIKKKKIT